MYYIIDTVFDMMGSVLVAGSAADTPEAGRVIEVRDLRMRYGDRDVLSGVGFSATAGEVVVLLGPNGAGKTTTIEILEGFRLQGVGQSFPMYWLGLGLRSAFLPGESGQRLWLVAGVLTVWAVIGLVLAPGVLRRMARRESGSLVAARRERAMARTV